MISPPSIQRLSTCLRIVFWERFSPMRCSMKGRKYATIFSPGGMSSAKPHPTARPLFQVLAARRQLGMHDRDGMVYGGSLCHRDHFHFTMELITILNQCHHFRGFVYERARFNRTDRPTIEVRVRPRKGSAAICSGCHQSAPGYDHLAERQFEFIPLWGFLVFLLYPMRRVNCGTCGIVVEEVPWASGKHQLTQVYRQFLAHWARHPSWKETAEAFHTSWEKVCHAVEYVVSWGLEHRTLGPLQALGVDEIQYAKGHKYLTLVYQIDANLTRLLWVGKERTVETSKGSLP